jgi:hypothetical protein
MRIIIGFTSGLGGCFEGNAECCPYGAGFVRVSFCGVGMGQRTDGGSRLDLRKARAGTARKGNWTRGGFSFPGSRGFFCVVPGRYGLG